MTETQKTTTIVLLIVLANVVGIIAGALIW